MVKNIKKFLISESEVKLTAELSALEFSTTELTKVTDELGKIVEYFDKIATIKVCEDNMESSVVNKINLCETREDKKPKLHFHGLMIAAGPVIKDYFFIVPRVK